MNRNSQSAGNHEPASPPRRSRLLRYGVALAIVAAGIGARALMDPLLGNHLPLVTIFGAIAVAVWYARAGPASLAAVLGYLVVVYLFVPPRHLVAVSQPLIPGSAGYV